ncbi:GNAT family N-acetyltransferase [Chitinophaga sp. sic0106]|uniref:GNAT family N-acetyltransferase n=1 Tax=Chitinophaga sp. sic0106 TaxID=2854785 RepID=UPI001C450C48|nr:GNAT family N-acetyltransferase [Chitinophaga sp. sic0106]MBV7531522.1 GNAT family N-acetyltransferase [Chitinophaga sp. sic0106]
MPTRFSLSLLQKWARGWAISREVPAPVAGQGALRIDVNMPDQVARYLFPEVCPEIAVVANAITRPLVFIKVCAAVEAVRPLLPAHWKILEPGFMMTCHWHRAPVAAPLPAGYTLSFTIVPGGLLAVIKSPEGDTAGNGRLIPVSDQLIFDRIMVDDNHRRKGLGTCIMTALAEKGYQMGISNGVLVATPMGRSLYESMGWKVIRPYTSAVIPMDANLP